MNAKLKDQSSSSSTIILPFWRSFFFSCFSSSRATTLSLTRLISSSFFSVFSSRWPWVLTSLWMSSCFCTFASFILFSQKRSSLLCLMSAMRCMAWTVRTQRSLLYWTGQFCLCQNSWTGSWLISLLWSLRWALVQANFLGLCLALKWRWHFGLQNLNALQSFLTNITPCPGYIGLEQKQHLSILINNYYNYFPYPSAAFHTGRQKQYEIRDRGWDKGAERDSRTKYMEGLLSSIYISISMKTSLKQAVEGGLGSNISASAKTNLNHIIQVTEEQETDYHPDESPKATTPVEVPPRAALSSLRRKLGCCRKWWRWVCPPPSKTQLQVEESELADVVQKLRNRNGYYAPVLPRQKESRKVLVLDLDETLIHTIFSKPAKYDYESDVTFNGKRTKIYIIKRFGLEAFLFEMSRIFQVVVFTASQKLYADRVLDLVDPKRRISHRLYREHCVVINKTYYLKNLNILGRDLSQVIIVDDNSIAGLMHPDNFYRIDQFNGSQKDRQLCRLSAFLKHIEGKKDILPIGDLRKSFEDMEIDLEEAVLNLEEAVLDPEGEGRSLNTRMHQYNHKKTDSEVYSLFKDEGESETTASQLVSRI